MLCGSEHDGTTCVKEASNHAWCLGWVDGVMVHWDNPDYVKPKVQDRRKTKTDLGAMAARVAPARSVNDPVSAAVEGSERAAGRWTPEQRQQVFDAVLTVAERMKRFTTDDVWAYLGDSVPTTMGIAAVLRRAVASGHIRPTSDFAYSQRQDRADHDYGRHLRVWQSTSMS